MRRARRCDLLARRRERRRPASCGWADAALLASVLMWCAAAGASESADNLIAASRGGQLVSGSPTWSSTSGGAEDWSNAVDEDIADPAGDGVWPGTVTARKDASPVYGIFALSQPQRIARIRLLTDTGVGQASRWLQNFRFLVSATGTQDADFRTVLTAVKAQTPGFQEFAFPQVETRYVKIVMDTNYGDANWIQLGELEVYAPDAPALALSASPQTIAAGQSAILTWTGTDAASCTASGGWSGMKPPSGSASVSPTATTTYTLSCGGSGGSDTQAVTVSVIAAPSPPTPLPDPGMGGAARRGLCEDGLDNDGDGRIDYPLDAGCSSYDDGVEQDEMFPPDFDPSQLPVDTQAWFLPPDATTGGSGFGHTHIACRLPIGQRVAGPLDTNCRIIQFHNNQAQIKSLLFAIDPPGRRIVEQIPVDFTCAGDHHACVTNVPVHLDPMSWGINGWVNLSATVVVETPPQDVETFFNSNPTIEQRPLVWKATNAIPLYIDHPAAGPPNYDTVTIGPSLIGMGWLEKAEQQFHAVQAANLPLAPLTGPHTFRFRVPCDLSTPSRKLVIAVDGLLHDIPASGPWPAVTARTPVLAKPIVTPGCGWHEVVVDPKALNLAMGWHWIAARSISEPTSTAQCAACTNEPVSQHAQLIMPFYVDATAAQCTVGASCMTGQGCQGTVTSCQGTIPTCQDNNDPQDACRMGHTHGTQTAASGGQCMPGASCMTAQGCQGTVASCQGTTPICQDNNDPTDACRLHQQSLSAPAPSAIGTGSVCPADWWNPAWMARRKIMINNPTGAALADIPVLVALDRRRIDYTIAHAAGQDLRFVDADNRTVLAHEIERFTTQGTSAVWVKVPRIPAGSGGFLWLYYGNPAAPDGQQPAQVWTNDYVAVYHLNDRAGPIVTDSARGLHGRAIEVPANEPAGRIGGAYSFGYGPAESGNGSFGAQEVCLAHHAAQVPVNEGCRSFWLKPEFDPDNRIPANATFPSYYVDSFVFDSAIWRGHPIEELVSSTFKWNVMDGAFSDGFGRIFPEGLSTNPRETILYERGRDLRFEKDEWLHFTLCWSEQRQERSTYLNGRLLSRHRHDPGDFFSDPTGRHGGDDQANRWAFGGTQYCNAEGITYGFHTNWVGMMDEVRYESAYRDDTWATVQYASQTDQLLMMGPAETCGMTPPPLPSPTVTITSPAPGAQLAGPTDVTVRYQIQGDLGQVHHAHLQVDAQPEVRDDWAGGATGEHIFTAVSAGPHTFTVRLARVDHTVLHTASVNVVVTAPAPPPPPPPPPPPSHDGDLNADGRVDVIDLGILLSQWNRGGSGDLNADGRVDVIDLGILLAHWS